MERSLAILDTKEEERSRIAKDLHDEVGGTLAELKLKLQNVRHLITYEKPDYIKKMLLEYSKIE